VKLKKLILSIIILFGVSISTFASFGFDIGLNYNSSEIDSNGDEIEREYPFSFVALPSISSGKFAIEFNAPLYFKIDTSLLTFDYSTYELPASENDITKDALNYTKFFLGFINYIQWSNFNEDFALRIGKITNSTIGDGALLYHYKDTNVTKFETRAGFQFKFDANQINLPLETEFITTDMFNPDLLGGRVAINPLFFLNNDFINKLTLGYTVLYNTEYNNPDENWFDLAYDIQLPLFENGSNSMITYYDLISEQVTNNDSITTRQLSQRAGIYGWYLTSYTYDMHIKNIIDNNGSFIDFANGNTELLSKTIIPQFKKDFIVSANTGYYSNNGLSDIILASELEFEDLELDNYNLNLTFNSEKAIGPISNIALYAEKNFFRDSITNEFSETFLDGFTTLKNINATISANIIFYQVNEITVNFNLVGDENGEIDPSYSIGYKFSVLK